MYYSDVLFLCSMEWILTHEFAKVPDLLSKEVYSSGRHADNQNHHVCNAKIGKQSAHSRTDAFGNDHHDKDGYIGNETGDKDDRVDDAGDDQYIFRWFRDTAVTVDLY